MTIHGNGDKDATVSLPPRARAAAEQAVDGRDERRYDRNRNSDRYSLGRHATYAIAQYIAGSE